MENKAAETIIMCDECIYKGLITDQFGNTFLEDEYQVNHPHNHSENLAYLTPVD